MNFLLRMIVGIALMGAGLVLVVKTYKIVQKIGYNDWAEQHLGGGGTYLLVKLIGMVIMLVSILIILGVINPFWFF